MARLEINEGDVFNRWTVLKEMPCVKTPKNVKRYFLCKCICGTERVVEISGLTTGHSKSCGCFHSEIQKRVSYKHGYSHSRYYDVWSNIVQRCYCETNESYYNYGGRGITVYSDWVSNPKLFIDYILSLPDANVPKLSLDRIDNSGNYEPGNLRWTTSTIQNRNKRTPPQNKTGFVGVHLQKNRFIANVCINNKTKYIGSFDTAIEAYQARVNYIIKNKLSGFII